MPQPVQLNKRETKKQTPKLKPLALRKELPRLNSGKIDIGQTPPQSQNLHFVRSAHNRHNYIHHDKYAEHFLNEKVPSAEIPQFVNQYLRPNAKYVGEQQSSVGIHDIRVELKTVDLVNSVVTGFFQISGLTDEHPLITTCFKGEIINNPLKSRGWNDNSVSPVKDYTFITDNHEWGSFPQNDLDHWKTLVRSSGAMSEDSLRRSLQDIYSGSTDSLFIYMRWKEEFLVPDSRIKQLKNASFEGFYYVVLNIGGGPADHDSEAFSTRIIPGTVSGLYYHTQNDKFQSLSLRYVEERGVSGVFDFQ